MNDLQVSLHSNSIRAYPNHFPIGRTGRGTSDNPYDDLLDEEKILSGPLGISMPYFMPFFDFQQSAYETQEMRFAYRKMLADPDVKAPLLAKIFGVGALELRINPADRADPRSREQADFCHWNITRRLSAEGMMGGMVGLAWNILIGGLVDGVSVNEPVWGMQEIGKWRGKEIIRQLKAKDVNQDLVLEADQFRNITGVKGMRYNAGVVWHPDNFIIFTHLPLFGNPTGMSDLRAAYSSWWFLDTIMKLRAMGAEKRALPVVAGEYPDPSKMAQVERSLSMVKSRSWIAVPREVKLSVLDIAGSAEDYFKSFCDDLRERIVMSIEGSTLNSMAGRKGQIRGDSQTHQNSADLRKWFLSACLVQILSDQEHGLIKRLIDRNFAEVSDYPYAALGGVEDAELEESLRVDKGLSDMGFQHRVTDIEERYGRQMATAEDETLVPSFLMQGSDPNADPNADPNSDPSQQGDRGIESQQQQEVPDFFSEGRRPPENTLAPLNVFSTTYHGPSPPGPGYHLAGKGRLGGNVWIKDPGPGVKGAHPELKTKTKSSGGKDKSTQSSEAENFVTYIKPKKSRAAKSLKKAIQNYPPMVQRAKELPEGPSVIGRLAACLGLGFITNECLELLLTLFMKLTRREIMDIGDEVGLDSSEAEDKFIHKATKYAIKATKQPEITPPAKVEATSFSEVLDYLKQRLA